MSENRNKTSNWNFGIMAAAAVAATGVAYYLGYKNGNETCQEQMHEQNPRATDASRSTATPCCKNPEECAICLKKMAPIQRLSCGHNYHQECISQWLPISPTCPLCREAQSE